MKRISPYFLVLCVGLVACDSSGGSKRREQKPLDPRIQRMVDQREADWERHKSWHDKQESAEETKGEQERAKTDSSRSQTGKWATRRITPDGREIVETYDSVDSAPERYRKLFKDPTVKIEPKKSE